LKVKDGNVWLVTLAGGLILAEAGVNLSLENIRFSNPAPEEGEEIVVEAVISNLGEKCSFDAVFYWAPEIILSNRQMEQYTKPEYEVYRERVEIAGGGKAIIRFRWKAKKGFACMFVKPENVKISGILGN